MKSSVLFIDTGDFESVPPGGTLNFAKQMLSSFGNRLALVGITTENLHVCPFFSVVVLFLQVCSE